MRKLLVVLAIVALASSGAWAAVATTLHDLSADDTEGRTCIFCHTPHNATPAIPLWNHTLSTNTFTAYDSPTMEAVDNGNWGGGDGNISGLCMSCHDGSVALGSIINAPRVGTVTLGLPMGAIDANLGTDLSNDHPVAFTYDGTLETADGELVDPTTLTGAVKLFGAGADQLECSSCHDPHNDTNLPFLVLANTNSALCNTCHLK